MPKEDAYSIRTLRTRLANERNHSSVPVADSLESELSAAKDRPLLRRAHRREWQLLEDAVPTDRGRVGLADEGEDVEVLGDGVLVACAGNTPEMAWVPARPKQPIGRGWPKFWGRGSLEHALALGAVSGSGAPAGRRLSQLGLGQR